MIYPQHEEPERSIVIQPSDPRWKILSGYGERCVYQLNSCFRSQSICSSGARSENIVLGLREINAVASKDEAQAKNYSDRENGKPLAVVSVSWKVSHGYFYF